MDLNFGLLGFEPFDADQCVQIRKMTAIFQGFLLSIWKKFEPFWAIRQIFIVVNGQILNNLI